MMLPLSSSSSSVAKTCVPEDEGREGALISPRCVNEAGVFSRRREAHADYITGNIKQTKSQVQNNLSH